MARMSGDTRRAQLTGVELFVLFLGLAIYSIWRTGLSVGSVSCIVLTALTAGGLIVLRTYAKRMQVSVDQTPVRNIRNQRFRTAGNLCFLLSAVAIFVGAQLPGEYYRAATLAIGLSLVVIGWVLRSLFSD